MTELFYSRKRLKITCRYTNLGNYGEIFEGIALEVLLHEFGHQLGLDHNSLQGCLMNDRTEFSRHIRKSGIIADFCEFEKKGN